MVYNRLKYLYDWLLPGRCLCCGDSGLGVDAFCSDCRRELPRLGAACPRCAGPGTTAGSHCGHCQQRPPPYDQVRAPFAYAPPIDRLIVGLKFQQRLDFARHLGHCLAAHLQTANDIQSEIIVPVPLHRRRLRQRGFNQALELARPVARRLRLPIDYHGLKRIRPTASQLQLPRRHRTRNVRNAFAADGRLAGRRVALVDDVMTSGATVDAACVALKKAGVESIEVWVLARA